MRSWVLRDVRELFRGLENIGARARAAAPAFRLLGSSHKVVKCLPPPHESRDLRLWLG